MRKFYHRDPCIIFGQYLTVKLWTINFNHMNHYLNTILAYIRLPNYLLQKGGFMGNSRNDWKGDQIKI